MTLLAHNHTCMSTGTSTYNCTWLWYGTPSYQNGHIIGQHRQNEVSRLESDSLTRNVRAHRALGSASQHLDRTSGHGTTWGKVILKFILLCTRYHCRCSHNRKLLKRKMLVCLFICELYFQHNENKLTSLMQTNPLRYLEDDSDKKKKNKKLNSAAPQTHYSHEHKTRLDIYVTFILPACIYL